MNNKYSPILNKSVIKAVSEMNEAQPLEDLQQIEELVIYIKKMEDRIEFLKDYKKKKNNAINDAIKTINNNIDSYKAVVRETMKDKSNMNTIHFPGMGKITLKKNKDKWSLTDEEAVIEYFKKNHPESKVVKEQVKEIIDKKELNKNLNAMEKNGEIDKIKDSVEKEKKEPSVVISLEDEYDDKDRDVEDLDSIKVPSKEETKNSENEEENDNDSEPKKNYDSLNI